MMHTLGGPLVTRPARRPRPRPRDPDAVAAGSGGESLPPEHPVPPGPAFCRNGRGDRGCVHHRFERLGGMYATHRHRREKGALAHDGAGGAGGGAKKRRTSPVLFCFVAATVLLGNAYHALFLQKKESSHGFSRRRSLMPNKPQGVKYELHTLPVDAKAVADGDTITVYVVIADHPGFFSVPQEVHRAATDRAEALMAKNYQRADELQKIILDAGFRQLTNSTGGHVLTKKYRIRLRGIDAPESSMPYGREAKEELMTLVQGNRLKISVYGNDRYGRLVADVDCNGVFVQEHMLKKGLAWHYIAYDQRLELARWENQAKASQMGLWSLPNPEKPWEWRKEKHFRISR
ncbi:probable staphylococcal-like nuclease CAN1 [Oryza brachyantha]|uniref:TNase-like domain-containing protein n=1 Tax=Oryza brachyantha TaxID=4533 RepID=J3KWP4_ORYBR|nr:probable staphylococcal-like nuclease CAN1 [Oryza brachyantha]